MVIVAVATMLLVGCKEIRYTTKGAYLGAMHELGTELKTIGLCPVGSSLETVNEPYVFDDEWKNDWVVYDTRRFADSLGNTATFTVRYRKFREGMINVEVSGCDVSRPDYYKYVCGDDGVIQRLNSLRTTMSK